MPSKTKQPYGKFFWSDWRGDTALRACSAASRGVWIDMLCIMAEADGYLLLAGKPITPAALANLISTPVEVITEALAELESWGVFSRTRAGVIYSRKMVKNAARSVTAKANGSKGGNPALLEDNGEINRSKSGDKSQMGLPLSDGNDWPAGDWDNQTLVNQSPESRVQKESTPQAAALPNPPTPVSTPPSEPAAAASDWPDLTGPQMLDRIVRDVGSPWVDPAKAGGLVTTSALIHRWRKAGYSYEVVVIPTIQALAARRDRAVTTWAYFDGAMADAHALATRPLPEGEARPAGGSRFPSRADEAAERDARLRAQYADFTPDEDQP